jgi:hypothetical protein
VDLGRNHNPACTRHGRSVRGRRRAAARSVLDDEDTRFQGYYDGHKDTFLVTDVSSKAQASALHINFSRRIGKVKGAPAQYFIRGRVAYGQLSVFGSEPGEADYNPLWEEFFVSWKPGVAPVLLVKDDQITALAKSKKLTLKDAHVVLNAPITKVTK